MPILTNEKKLPRTIIRALRNDPYDNQGSDFTATSLISPPQKNRLIKEHGDKMTEDASEKTNALLGTAAHSVVEMAAKPWLKKIKAAADAVVDGNMTMEEYIEISKDQLEKAGPWIEKTKILCERRFSTLITVDGVEYKVSSQTDLIEGTHLMDAKTVSVWGVVFRDKSTDWLDQLSINAWLARKAGHVIETASILALVKDWSERDYETAVQRAWGGKEPDYPSASMLEIPFQLRSDVETEALVIQAIRDNVKPQPRECTIEEMWAKEDTTAVFHRPGLQRASKVFRGANQTAEADDYMASVKAKQPKVYAEFRAGERTRCSRYCLASTVCPQHTAYLKTI